METELQTENFNSILVLPPVITVVVIVILLSFNKWRLLLWENKLISSLLGALIILNIIEIITYGNIYKNYSSLLKAYYSISIFAASIICLLGIRLISLEKLPTKLFTTVLLIFCSTLIILVLTTSLIIRGVEVRPLSISRDPGDFYWTLQLYISICVSAGLFFIWKSISRSSTRLDKKRRIVILYAFIPIIFSVLLVILLMQLGINITWSHFLPITTLFFVIVYLFTENKKDLFRFLVNVPFSNERKAYKQLNTHVLDYISKTQTDEPVLLKNMMSEIEKIFITNALEIKDGNHNLAAELLSISLSTVYRHKEKPSEKNQD